MAKFEIVSKWADAGLTLPQRGTARSAGYDLCVAEDITIPPISDLSQILTRFIAYNLDLNKDTPSIMEDDIERIEFPEGFSVEELTYDLNRMALLTKQSKCRPNLVSTGLKCKLADDEFLSIQPRSSSPFKYWLFIANTPAIVDADYYNNPDNEGEIYLEVINLSPIAIKLKKGDRIAQGIIQKYIITEDDVAEEAREGGLGSTGA